MKLSFPRLFLLAAGSAAVLVPAFSSRAMDIMERIVTTQTQAIRYEATEYQRKIAEAHARAYMTAQRKAPVAKTAKTEKSGTSTSTSASTSKTPKKSESKEANTAKTKLPRYVAIDTVKDKRAAPGTKKVVMIWDTQSEALVSNSVYDVASVPSVGSTMKFDTYSAQYVGEGQ